MSAQRVRSFVSPNNGAIVVGGILVADSQTIVAGDLVQINSSSRKLEAGVAASTTLVGYANESITTTTATAADVISITLLKGQVVRMAVSQAGTKKTFAQTDLYTTAYDLLDKVSIAPDDTTGGMCFIIAYDNTLHTADVIFKEANLASIG